VQLSETGIRTVPVGETLAQHGVWTRFVGWEENNRMQFSICKFCTLNQTAK
jgi:hypothetical protein